VVAPGSAPGDSQAPPSSIVRLDSAGVGPAMAGDFGPASQKSWSGAPGHNRLKRVGGPEALAWYGQPRFAENPPPTECVIGHFVSIAKPKKWTINRMEPIEASAVVIPSGPISGAGRKHVECDQRDDSDRPPRPQPPLRCLRIGAHAVARPLRPTMRRLKTTRWPNQQHTMPKIVPPGKMIVEVGQPPAHEINHATSIRIPQAPSAMNGMPTIRSSVRWMKCLMPRLYRGCTVSGQHWDGTLSPVGLGPGT
jgi:hypothetical protein